MGICLSTSSSAAGSNDRLDNVDAPRGCPSVAPLTTVGRTPLAASAFVSVVTTSTPHVTPHVTTSPSSPEEEQEEPDATSMISPTSKPQPMTMALFSADDGEANVTQHQNRNSDGSYSSLRNALRQQQQQFGLSSTATSQTRSPPVCLGNYSNTSEHHHQLSQHSLLLGDGEGSSFCFQESVMLELPSPSLHHQVHFSESVIVLDSTDDDDKSDNSNSSIGKLASIRNFDCPPHKSQLATPRRHQHLLKYQDQQQQQQLSTATSAASVVAPLSNGLSLVFQSAEVMPRLVHHRE